MNKKITILLLLLLASSSSTELTARGGSGAGWFAGGLATGAILGSAASRGRGDRSWQRYAQDLEYEIDDLKAENRELKQELREANRSAR